MKDKKNLGIQFIHTRMLLVNSSFLIALPSMQQFENPAILISGSLNYFIHGNVKGHWKG